MERLGDARMNLFGVLVWMVFYVFERVEFVFGIGGDDGVDLL